jgi:hypothetical protein
MKEVKKIRYPVNLKLFVFQQLKRGLNPKKISKQFNLSETRIHYYLSSLKRDKFIKKIGYGTWEILKEFTLKELQKDNPYRYGKKDNLDNNLKLFKSDIVRGHAFQFTLSIDPNLRNWNKREEILKRLDIPFKNLKIIGGGQSLTFKRRKIWLTNKSIVIFEKSSYMAETSKEAKEYAIYDMISLVGGLERYLRANFGATRGKLRFKISRQHYALIKNALARQYDREGKKLYVTNEKGRWFEIDNSFNLHEAETIHPKTSEQDNKKVQDFFNGIKQYEGFTPMFLIESMGKITKNQLMFDANMQSHIKAVQDLGKGVQELTKIIKELEKR